MSNSDGIRVFTAGHPGQGKTNLLMALTKDDDRLVVIDPKHSWRKKRRALNLYVAETMREFLDVFQAGWKAGAFRIVFEPDEDEEAQASDIAKLILELQRPYMEDHSRGKTTLAIDEIADVLPNTTQAKANGGVMKAARQGREMGLNIYGGTQYPVECSLKFRRLCDRALILNVASDARTVVESLISGRPDIVQAVESVRDYSYIAIDKIDGTFKKKPPAPVI